ncbi:hypothetical protein ABT023_16345 [Micromonospora sp. NPDC002296]|uniref:hypothetical protein n=1 Tax=Micromonospora sp. NPDC002296 TaxID=3154271 RepID=UPI00332410FB
MTTDPNSLLMGSGAPTAKFDQIGTVVSGTVVAEPRATQQTNFRTKLPEVWKDGSPKMQVIVRLATSLRDPQKPDDDGERDLYIKGRELTKVIRDAVRASGANGIHTGGVLTVQYVGDGQPESADVNPPKLYTAQYVPPAVSFGGITGPTGQPPAQPAYTPAAAPVQHQIPLPVQQPAVAPAPVAPANPAAAVVGGPPPGVDPAMWAVLTDDQRRAVLAASGTQPAY